MFGLEVKVEKVFVESPVKKTMCTTRFRQGMAVLTLAGLQWDRGIAAEDVPDLSPPVLPGGIHAGIPVEAPGTGNIVEDPEETGWASVRNLTSIAFTADFNVRKEDSILLDIEVDNVNGEERISGVWQKNPEGREWAAYRNLTSSSFGERWTEYREAGYRLIDQESYVIGGERLYAGIWIKNLEGYDWASYRNLTNSQFRDYAEQFQDTHALVDFEAYPVGADIRYAGAWVENAGHSEWFLRWDRSDAQFSADFEDYKGLYRIHDVESYQVAGQQKYGAIWIKNTNGRRWIENRDMDAKGYRNRWLRYRDLGYRLTDFEQYQTRAGVRYAGVWRQNSDRPDWSLRGTVNGLAEAFLESNGVSGLGVAVVHQGEVIYKRGFGSQDNEGTWYSAQTLNRLASVSKAVGGVLLYQLAESGQIDPQGLTADYVPGLPAHHTHTLAQLASNRGGVGHYPEHGLGTLYTQYDTALEASGLFWDDPLVSPPGTAYNYSTHGYTLLGAAIEGATGLPLSEVVDNALGSGIGLSDLKVEERTVASEFRSELFNDNNTVATADNISWKVLGGGLECSVEDMAHFCRKLMAGEILSPAGLEAVWVRPDSLWTYAMGWNSLRFRDGLNVPCVMKSGAQFGADTHIRLFPSLELGIVAFSNTRQNANTSSLTRDIASAILDCLPPVLTLEPLSGSAVAGEVINLTVEAVSNSPLSYQWFKDDLEIPFETAPLLSLPASGRGVSGTYRAVVSNAAGVIVSGEAHVRVLAPLVVESLGRTDAGAFQLRFGDREGHPLREEDRDFFMVEWSEDLDSWNLLKKASLTLVDGGFVVEDASSPEAPARYYRIREVGGL